MYCPCSDTETPAKKQALLRAEKHVLAFWQVPKELYCCKWSLGNGLRSPESL